jgi:hypothetical protein
MVFFQPGGGAAAEPSFVAVPAAEQATIVIVAKVTIHERRGITAM